MLFNEIFGNVIKVGFHFNKHACRRIQLTCPPIDAISTKFFKLMVYFSKNWAMIPRFYFGRNQRSIILMEKTSMQKVNNFV